MPSTAQPALRSSRWFALPLLLVIVSSASFARDDYFKVLIDQDDLQGAPDFSRLNHPLGSADRVFVRDGHFYVAGPDAKPFTSDDLRIRFFGVNLVGSANFPRSEDAERIAKRLRRLGVNLVRLHLMDRWIGDDPYDMRSLLSKGPFPTFKPLAIQRLRTFLDALRQQGIYCDLNLYVGYTFRPEIDELPPLPLDAGKKPMTKPLEIFYPRMIHLQEEYAQRLIEALNLRGDPILAMVEIVNESSLVGAWQQGALDQLTGPYADELRKQWNDFLLKQYGSRHEIERAWGMQINDADAPLLRSTDELPQARLNDYLHFLIACERSYFDRIRNTVRDATDGLVPISGTQMEFGGLSNLDSQSGLSYSDVHFYVDHYDFPASGSWDEHNWRISDSSNAAQNLSRFFDIAAARVAGRPFVVSEFNQPWPNRQAAEIVPSLAAFAAFQDWDALIFFNYDSTMNWDDPVPHGFALNGDYAKLASFGQSAWLFRTAAIRPAKEEVSIPISRDTMLHYTRYRRDGNFAVGLKDELDYNPQVALQHRVALETAATASKLRSGRTANPLRSDTGELILDAHRKTFAFAAPQTVGIFGYLGRKRMDAGPLALQLPASSRGFAALLLVALDQVPIQTSKTLLLSLPGHTFGTTGDGRRQELVRYRDQPGWWTLAPRSADDPSSHLYGEHAPVWMERVECTITLKSKAHILAVYPLDAHGNRLAPLSPRDVQRSGSTFRIHLQADGQAFSPWYEIVAGD